MKLLLTIPMLLILFAGGVNAAPAEAGPVMYFSPYLFGVFAAILYGLGYRIRRDQLIKTWYVKLAYSIIAPLIVMGSITLLILFFKGEEAADRSVITSATSLLFLIPYSFFTIRTLKPKKPKP